MRRWMEGENVDGLPSRKGTWAPSKIDEEMEEADEDVSRNPKIEIKSLRAKCSDCDGKGTVWANGEVFTGERTCVTCRGEGYISIHTPKDKNGLASRIKSKVNSAGRYTISTSGDNALLKFGKHNGKMLTQIVEEGNRSYLEFILKETFPEELKDVCRYLLRKIK
jgi:hypothetical protein